MKGLIWYSPKLHDYSSAPPKTWDDLTVAGDRQQGRCRRDLVRRPRVRRGLRLAGHGLDRGHRPSPGRTREVYNQLVGRQDEVDRSGDQGRVRDVRRRGRQRPTAVRRRGRSDQDFRAAATRCSPIPPGCALPSTRPASSPGSAGSRARLQGPTTTSSRSRTSNPQFAGAVEGAGDLFGMFHDTEEAKSLMKYLVTAPGPGHLGQDRRRAVRQQERDELSRRHRKRSAELLANAKSLRVRRVGPDAERR